MYNQRVIPSGHEVWWSQRLVIGVGLENVDLGDKKFESGEFEAVFGNSCKPGLTMLSSVCCLCKVLCFFFDNVPTSLSTAAGGGVLTMLSAEAQGQDDATYQRTRSTGSKYSRGRDDVEHEFRVLGRFFGLQVVELADGSAVHVARQEAYT